MINKGGMIRRHSGITLYVSYQELLQTVLKHNQLNCIYSRDLAYKSFFQLIILIEIISKYFKVRYYVIMNEFHISLRNEITIYVELNMSKGQNKIFIHLRNNDIFFQRASTEINQERYKI